MNDLTANTLGTAIGAGIVFSSRRKIREADMLAYLWVLWNGFMLLPALNGAPLPTEGLDAALLWIGSVNAFLGFWALGSIAKTRFISTALLAVAPAAVLWIYPSLAVARVLSAAGGVLVARYRRPQWRILGPVCLVWLAFQELYPFNWQRPAQTFSWIPFETLFYNRPQTYYPLIFGKLFFYTTVVWCMRYGKRSWVVAGVIPAAVLAAGEGAQLLLPGRTPELTDFALLFGGAFLLWLVEGERLSTRQTAPAGTSHQVRSAH